MIQALGCGARQSHIFWRVLTSFGVQSFRRECSLSSDDTFTVGGQSALQVERDYFYSEKGACKTGKCPPGAGAVGVEVEVSCFLNFLYS